LISERREFQIILERLKGACSSFIRSINGPGFGGAYGYSPHFIRSLHSLSPVNLHQSLLEEGAVVHFSLPTLSTWTTLEHTL
jgi:hypothetical protein